MVCALFGNIGHCRRHISLEIESKIIERFKSLPGRPVNDFRNYPLEYTRGIHLASIRDSLQPRTKVELMIPHPCTVERTMEDAIAKEKGRLLVSAISSRFRARKLKTDVTDQWYLSDKNHFVLTVEGENRKEILTSISTTVSLLNDLIRNGWQEDELQDIKNNFCRRMKLSTDAPSRPSSMWCDDFADYVISGRPLSDRSIPTAATQRSHVPCLRPIFANIAQGVDVLP